MIITDSLGSPRKDNQILYYKDTWPCLLSEWFRKNKNYNHFVFTRKGLDTSMLNGYVKLKLDLYDKSDIFLHVGIVDCSRRVLSEKALRFVTMIPVFRDLVKWIAHKYHYKLTKTYKVVYISEKDFKNNLLWFIKEFKESRIWILPILPVGESFRKISYDIDNQIKRYNNVIENIAENNSNVEFFKQLTQLFNNNDQSLYMRDGYHLNRKSHKIIYDFILNRFTNL